MNELVFNISNFTGDEAEVQLTLVEENGDIRVTTEVINPLGDLRGIFFNITDNSLLANLTVTGDNVTESQFGPANTVSDLGQGANINPGSFDAGVEIGTPGIGTDDIASTTFVISHPTTDLTLDLFDEQSFGVRLTSVGTEDRSGSSKLSGVASDEPQSTPSPFIDFEYFRQTFEAEILTFFGVQSTQVITDAQIFSYLLETGLSLGITESQLTEFQFYSETYEAELLTQFNVSSLTEISFTNTYQFLIDQGLEDGENFSFLIDIDYFRQNFSNQLTSFYNVTSITEVSTSQTFEYILNVGLDLGLNPSPYVDLEFYRTTFEAELISFYGVASITEVTFSQVFEYLVTVGLDLGHSPSPLIDLDFFEDKFKDSLKDFFGDGSGGDDDDDSGCGDVDVDDDDDSGCDDDDDDDDDSGSGDDNDGDGDGSGDGDTSHNFDSKDIFQFIITTSDETEPDTSPLFDFQYYVSTFSAELTAFYGVASVEEISFQQVYEYASTVGLEQGFQTSLTADFEFYREVYAEQLIAFYNVTTVAELTTSQVLNFIATEFEDLPSVVFTDDNLLVLGGRSISESVNLEINLTSNSNTVLGELGVFAVQDSQGGVDLDDDGVIDITPDDANYIQQVLSSDKAEVIFSVLPDTDDLDVEELERIIEGFESGDRLAFYLVEGSTTDAVITGQVSAEVVTIASTFSATAFNQLEITESDDDEEFKLNWIETGLEIEVEATSRSVTLGASLQGQLQAEVLDFRAFGGEEMEIEIIEIDTEAAFSNTVGFYRIEDTNGAVRDPLTGALIDPSDQANYAQAALRQTLEVSQGFSFDADAENDEFVVSGGFLMASFIIADGTVEEFLTENPTNALLDDTPAAYFSVIGANPDGADHVRLLGDNTFGFEDLPGGGDQDFNDFVYQLDVRVA
ncbi:MAG: DUF4114 domain-containing protein [Leptolyngbyaceae cyanobacterium]